MSDADRIGYALMHLERALMNLRYGGAAVLQAQLCDQVRAALEEIAKADEWLRGVAEPQKTAEPAK